MTTEQEYAGLELPKDNLEQYSKQCLGLLENVGVALLACLYLSALLLCVAVLAPLHLGWQLLRAAGSLFGVRIG